MDIFEKIISVNSVENNVIYRTMKALRMIRTAARIVEVKFEERFPDANISFEVTKNSDYVFEMKFGRNILAFVANPIVFTFPKGHAVFRNLYVADDKNRAFCGVIDVYNFLSESFRLKQMEDLGALIGRIYVNMEGHFFVEGDGALASVVNKFESCEFDDVAANEIVSLAIETALDFKVPFLSMNDVKAIHIDDYLNYRDKMQLRNGKKIGFE